MEANLTTKVEYHNSSKKCGGNWFKSLGWFKARMEISDRPPANQETLCHAQMKTKLLTGYNIAYYSTEMYKQENYEFEDCLRIVNSPGKDGAHL